MQHFSQDAVGKAVVDVHGEHVGDVVGIEDGYARLKAETGVAASMEAAMSPAGVEGLAVAPEQVEEITEDYVRVELES
ncbi:hypothetical protein JCM17823_14790 [Halorubrum gandharaense]